MITICQRMGYYWELIIKFEAMSYRKTIVEKLLIHDLKIEIVWNFAELTSLFIEMVD
jgi:hypothetical protein